MNYLQEECLIIKTENLTSVYLWLLVYATLEDYMFIVNSSYSKWPIMPSWSLFSAAYIGDDFSTENTFVCPFHTLKISSDVPKQRIIFLRVSAFCVGYPMAIHAITVLPNNYIKRLYQFNDNVDNVNHQLFKRQVALNLLR